MAHSLLMIPVPELDAVVRPRLERCSPEHVPADPDEVIAHVTLLGPFADLADVDHGLVSELEAFFADVVPFAFRLTGISWFPGGTVYLTPEPVRPFRALTHELHRRFPEYPPYRGAFDEVVPHLTVPLDPEGADGSALDQLRFEVEPRLPFVAHAREARLSWVEPGASRTLEIFPFGTTAA